ncbi:MAG: response regulator transcription factor [Clostridia bacterium]|jgi:DNA-binding NarL/FixJ family response regulator|nr:response regulator transcription factor [Clostridia bacterium]
MIKVLLVDDQQILAEGIKSVLQTSAELEVVGIASDGVRAVEACKTLKPDVVLMDIRMPNMNGVVATKRIKEADENVKIIILTTFDDSDYILSAINNGASGYLLKDIGATALIDAIKNAYAGDTILPAKIAKKITSAAALVSTDKEYKLRKAYGLSEREVEIALMLYDGFTNRQIAAALKLSDGTARNYISTIYLKLGADNRNAAMEIIKNLS